MHRLAVPAAIGGAVSLGAALVLVGFPPSLGSRHMSLLWAGAVVSGALSGALWHIVRRRAGNGVLATVLVSIGIGFVGGLALGFLVERAEIQSGMPVLLWGAAGAMLGLVFALGNALVPSVEKGPTLGTFATARRAFLFLIPLGVLLVLATFFF